MKYGFTIFLFLFVCSINGQFFLTENLILNAVNRDSDSMQYGENVTIPWYELEGNKISRIGTYSSIYQGDFADEYEEFISFSSANGLIIETRSKLEWCSYYPSGHLKERILLDANGRIRHRVVWMEKIKKEETIYSKYIIATYENGKMMDCKGKGCTNENIEKNRFILLKN
jgi:hypothetical protein